jgi:two-component system CAI-1 autoinducer sensor kinase/phosphatase CqsS
MKTEDILSNFHKYIKGKMKIISLIGIVGYPLYYFVWKYFMPESYENLPLRILCAIISLPWLFSHLTTEKTEKKYTIYTFASIMFCLPFFFSFMWIKNDFSPIWTMSYIAQLFLLFLLVYSWSLIYITSIVGFGLACISIYLLDGNISFSGFQIEYIPVFLFMILASLIFHRHEAEHVEKQEVLTAFGVSIAHEMRNSIAISIGSSRIVKRILNFPKDKNEFKNKIEIDADDALEIQQTMELLENNSFRTSMVIDLILKNVHCQEIEVENFKNQYIFDTITTALNEFGYKEYEKDKIRILNIDNFLFYGDKDLAVFTIFNILNNAFTYNNAENCEIEIWTEKHLNHNSLHIKDNGPGIQPDKINVIFDRFTSFGNKGGAGLGLTFCKRVMNSFQGDIICESILGKHSEFILEFPLVKTLNKEKNIIVNTEKQIEEQLLQQFP